MSKVGLVTVLFNSEEVLEGFFKSLSAQSFTDYQLYLIDNKPSPIVRSLIQELTLKYPIRSFKHIENPVNTGVARGNNQGIECSMSDGCTHTLLLNNDIEFDQVSLLEEMYEYSTSHNEPIIIPKICYFDTGKVWMAGGRFRKGMGTVYHVGLGADDGPRYNRPAYFTYAPTCFMLIDNKVFDTVGIMDDRFFVYYDDTDFIYRASRKGYKIFFMPSLTVAHKVSSSTGGGESLFSLYYGTRNRIYFLRKNFKGISKLIPMLYTLVTRAMRWVTLKKVQRAEVIRAIGDGFRMKLND